MTDRELLQMALDALEDFRGEYGWLPKQEKAWETLRARLAQPEPVAQFEFQNYGWWRDEEGKLQLGTQPQGE